MVVVVVVVVAAAAAVSLLIIYVCQCIDIACHDIFNHHHNNKFPRPWDARACIRPSARWLGRAARGGKHTRLEKELDG